MNDAARDDEGVSQKRNIYMLMNLSGFDNVDQSSVVIEKRKKRSYI